MKDFSFANIANLSFLLIVIELDEAIARRDDDAIVAILDVFMAYWIRNREK
jgi:hypothetical protein